MKRTAGILPLSLAAALLFGGCALPGGRVSQTATLSPRTAPKVQFVRFKTDDGLSLSGRVYGNGRVGIILAHMYPADQKSWAATARYLSGRGYTVLTFDFRGYGLSGGVKDIPKIDTDMRAALDYLRRTNGKVFLIGASMGGTAALTVASQNHIAGIATLSAPEEFMGLKAGKIESIEGPKLFMAAGGDSAAPETARRHYSKAGEPKEIQILPGTGHGTDMLGGDDGEALRLLEDWLRRYD